MIEAYPGIAGFVAAFVLWAAAASAFAKLLDWLTSAKAKSDLNDKVIRFWAWLDDNRDLHWLRRFQTSPNQRKMVGLITGVLLLSILPSIKLLRLNPFDVTFAAIGVISSAVLLLKARFGVDWITSARGAADYVIRNVVVCFVIFAAIFVALFMTTFFSVAASFDGNPWSYSATSQVIDYFAFFLIGTFGSFQLYFWSITMLYIAGLACLFVLGAALRLILVRTAEYPGGPILAIGTLIGALGAVAEFLIKKT